MTKIKPMLAHKFDEARINFKKDIEWVKNNKHLITVRFSKIIFKY